MGLYYREKFKNGAEIAVWEITETENQLSALCVLPNDEQEELSYISSEKRRIERLAVRALLDLLFPEKVYLRYHENGRPFLQNSIVELSIAHTGRFACVITHPENSVGIDIEALSRNFASVEARAVNEEEREALSDKSEIRSHQLAIIWCAKEALYKYMSQNDVDFARQMEIARFYPREQGEIQADFIHKDRERESFTLEYTILDDHVMVWLVG